MDPMTASALISTGGQLLGGLLGKKTSAKSAMGQLREQSTIQLNHQEAMDKLRPSWVVEGANKAGIHPLVAMGAQPVQGGSFSVSGGSENNSHWLADMGQSVGRAAEAYLTQDQRAKQSLLDGLAVERAQLENDLLRAQATNVNRSSAAIPLPSATSQVIPGQGNSSPSAAIDVVPNQVTASRFGVPAQEAGAINDYAYVRTPSGYAVVPSADAKNRIEDQLIPELAWAARNYIQPMWKGLPPPSGPDYPPPPGYTHWKWSKWYQEFRPAK